MKFCFTICCCMDLIAATRAERGLVFYQKVFPANFFSSIQEFVFHPTFFWNHFFLQKHFFWPISFCWGILLLSLFFYFSHLCKTKQSSLGMLNNKGFSYIILSYILYLIFLSIALGESPGPVFQNVCVTVCVSQNSRPQIGQTT